MSDVTETTESSPQVLRFGGRSFRAIDFDRRTVALDHYLMRLTRASGVDKVMPMDGEANEAYLFRLQTLMIDSGLVCDILGGYLLPVEMAETNWTTAVAKQTSKCLSTCNTQQEREEVLALAMEVVFGFFKQGLESLVRSQKFLAQQAAPRPASEQAPN